MRNQNDDRHSGSTFDSFLEEEGLLEEVEAVSLKRVIAWQLKKAMDSCKITKQQMAKQLRTSRTQVDRLLDPSHTGVSIATVSKAAHVVGKRIRFEIIDGGHLEARHRRATKSTPRNAVAQKRRV